jgi:hypothetical protein
MNLRTQKAWRGIDFEEIDPKGTWRNQLVIAALELVRQEAELPPENRKLKFIHGMRNDEKVAGLDGRWQSAVNDFLEAASCLCFPVPELQ